MNAVLESHCHASRRICHVRRGVSWPRSSRVRTRRDLQEKFAHGDGATEALPDNAKAAVGGYDDGREQALRAPREEIQVEAKERVPGAHLRALPHMSLEPLARERNRVDADVQQDLAAAWRAHRHRVAGGGEHHDFSIARGIQRAGGRIDRQSIAEHACSEHFIGRLIERGAPAGERRQQRDRAAAVHESCAQSITQSGLSVRRVIL